MDLVGMGRPVERVDWIQTNGSELGQSHRRGWSWCGSAFQQFDQ